MFLGELLEVQTGEYNSLVFHSKKYDMGLKKMVECSESIGIPEETMQFLSNYKKHVGEIVAVGVSAVVTKKGKIFKMVQTDVMTIDELNQAAVIA